MSRGGMTGAVRWMILGVLSLLMGCRSPFDPQSAREVSRDKLLAISEKEKSDHLLYVGSDFQYHYAFDSRAGKERTYKVNAKQLRLKDTFAVGEDAYVLHPWLIEGKLLGYPAEDLDDAMIKSAHRSQAYPSDMQGTPQPVVEGSPQAEIGKSVGDDQVESGSVESP